MAQCVTLRDDTGMKLLQFYNATVDICNSHTLIFKEFEIISLPFKIFSIDITSYEVAVYYKNGANLKFSF